jgi:hypothetical protein
MVSIAVQTIPTRPNRLPLCLFLLTISALLAFPGGCINGLAPSTDIDASPRWYKGNLHTHSLWSDGDDFPEMIAQWYRDRGYNFLALSDHNVLSEGERWMKISDIRRRGGMDSLVNYQQHYGWRVNMRGGPDEFKREVRLKALSEWRSWIEQPGQFIMIQSEEISDHFEKLPIHMNATNIVEAIQPQGGNSVREVIANNLNAVEEQAERVNQPILPHLNHPNFGWGVTAEDLAHVVQEHFFEIYNGHPSVNQLGDNDHPSVEKIWDIANTIRLGQLSAPPLMGLATDDSHHYHVQGISRSAPGRGWVMIRARHLDAESLIHALKAGDFYASSGVSLRDVRFASDTQTIQIDIEPDGDASYTTHFVGTPLGTAITSPAVGTTFASVSGLHAEYKLTGQELYVRAIVVSSKPADNPSIKDQRKQAWTQPVGWQRWLQ